MQQPAIVQFLSGEKQWQPSNKRYQSSDVITVRKSLVVDGSCIWALQYSVLSAVAFEAQRGLTY